MVDVKVYYSQQEWVHILCMDLAIAYDFKLSNERETQPF